MLSRCEFAGHCLREGSAKACHRAPSPPNGLRRARFAAQRIKIVTSKTFSHARVKWVAHRVSAGRNAFAADAPVDRRVARNCERFESFGAAIPFRFATAR